MWVYLVPGYKQNERYTRIIYKHWTAITSNVLKLKIQLFISHWLQKWGKEPHTKPKVMNGLCTSLIEHQQSIIVPYPYGKAVLELEHQPHNLRPPTCSVFNKYQSNSTLNSQYSEAINKYIFEIFGFSKCT